MLQIAVCDDQPGELEIINAYITEYLVTHTLEAEIKNFSHPDKLLTAIEAEGFHLYLLDIVISALPAEVWGGCCWKWKTRAPRALHLTKTAILSPTKRATALAAGAL